MPDIQSPDPGRKLQDRYNLIGTTPAPFLSPELVPVVLVDDLSEDAPGFLWAIAADTVTGVAALNSQTALTNPSGSGVLIENIAFRFGNEVISVWNLFTAGPALTSAAVEVWQDTRRSGSPAAVVTLGTDVGAVTGPIARGRNNTDEPVLIDLPNYIMEPGERLHFLAGVDNDLNFYWTWSERILPPER